MAGYHHGNLRAAALSRAASVIAAAGPDALNLRALAAELGVSHNAFRHHFTDRTGLLTALATEGHQLLSQKLTEALSTTGSFQELGVAYVLFAESNPGQFTVMFQPDLLDLENQELKDARISTFAFMQNGVASLSQSGQEETAAAAVIAAWSLVHGLASLALSGNLEAAGIRQLLGGGKLESIARQTTGMLYGSPDREEN